MYGVAPIKDVLEGAVGFVMSVDHARERAKDKREVRCKGMTLARSVCNATYAAELALIR